MTNKQIIDFAMKLKHNLITKLPELINDNKQFREKLHVIEGKFHDLQKENETLQSKVMIAEWKSATLSMNHKKLNDKIIEMGRNMLRPEQYSRL